MVLFVGCCDTACTASLTMQQQSPRRSWTAQANCQHEAMSRSVVIRIRLFAALREQAGWAEQEWTTAITAEETRLTPAIIWKQLDLPGNCASVRVAINHQFATPDTELRTGDELGFLPPISGG